MELKEDHLILQDDGEETAEALILHWKKCVLKMSVSWFIDKYLNIYKNNFRRLDMKQYGFIDPTYYVASNVFQLLFLFILGWQIKISDSNQGMRPQPWVPGIKNPH